MVRCHVFTGAPDLATEISPQRTLPFLGSIGRLVFGVFDFWVCFLDFWDFICYREALRR